ncbi:hypothetical protein AMTRI_Chr06g173110 [Amborella trichopoda]
MELHGMSVGQMIEQLMNTNGDKHRGWRPVLQSIPDCESCLKVSVGLGR